MGDVGGFGRPRGDRAGAGGDDLDEAGDFRCGAARAVSQEFFEDGPAVGSQADVGFHHVDELGADGEGGQAGGGQVLKELGEAESGEGG